MADKPIGELIDELDKLRDKVRDILEKAKPFEEQYDLLEKEILSRLLADKNDQARGKLASVTVGRSIVGTIKDWEKLQAFVKKTGYFHLFNRSVGAASFRELYQLEMSKVKPGKTDAITEQRRKDAEQKFVDLTGLAPFEKLSLKHNKLKATA